MMLQKMELLTVESHHHLKFISIKTPELSIAFGYLHLIEFML